jgi:3',5'-cyclic AMP phosphodiesterase CpdA
VPSGGVLEPSQIAWLTSELQAAPTSRPLIVALHHPPYSVDAHHGGSAKMGAALDGVFNAAGRWPELVLSGHVHDYQRFTRTVTGGLSPTYIVEGGSGYHNLHELAGDATPGMDLGGGVTFEYGDASGWGYLVLAVETGRIAGEYAQVAKDGTVNHNADTFTL